MSGVEGREAAGGDSRVTVSVAIPTLNAGPRFREVLEAVSRQQTGAQVEIVVCDSGSSDGTLDLAREYGADYFQIPRGSFSHGKTRNLLVSRASGDLVFLLSQDAVPATERWIESALEAFDAGGESLAMVHGPYLPRPGAGLQTTRELEEFFKGFSDGGKVVYRAMDGDGWRDIGRHETFFTSSNGAIRRQAWEQVPYPEVPYAEDRLLAMRMLEAGYSKAYVPSFSVIHSHDYPQSQLLRRYFDEFRGLREAFGHTEPLDPRRGLRRIVDESLRDRNWALTHPERPESGGQALLSGLRHHSTRWLGSVLGSRADRLSPRLRQVLSLEGRSSFEPYGTSER